MKRLSAINSVAMKVVLGVAVVSTAMLLGASSPIKNTRQEKEPVQTELMSKESAEAPKLISLQQTKQSVPTAHNPKLDATLMKFAENQDDVAYIKNFTNDAYLNYGTYMGSAIVQSQIDVNMFLAFLDGNKEVLKNFPDGDALYKAASAEGGLELVKTKSEEIKKWILENYEAIYSPLFNKFSYKPNAEETINALDEYVRVNNRTFENRYWQVYTNPSEQFQLKQQNISKSIVQKNSDLIAYKIYLADMSLFRNIMKKFGLGRSETKLNPHDRQNMNHAYIWGFSRAVEPSVD